MSQQVSRSRRRKRRLPPGWIPNYHGAWAMVIIPPILGAILGGWRWEHAILFAFWMVGYFDFFAIGQWLRSRFKPRYRTPVIVYTVIAAVLGIAVVIVAPRLLMWVPAFLPLVLATFLASWHRKDRSMFNDLVTIAAGCLMLPVSFHLAVGGSVIGGEVSPATNWSPAWIATLFLFGYFVGTVFYVKTNVRERGKPGWFIASIVWHACFTVGAFIASAAWTLSALNGIVWIALTLRAIAVPQYGQRYGWLSARVIGGGEFVFSVLVALTLLI